MDGNRRLRKANQTVNTSKASVVEPTKEKVASLVKEKQSTMARTQLDRLSEVGCMPAPKVPFAHALLIFKDGEAWSETAPKPNL